jgi:dihydrofolate synthase/folylpolyglutamate synthase
LFGLERVRTASARYGHPERRAESLHIAGTNGKGSVAAMAASMARAQGKRVGLYTSPHLCRFRERIQVDGLPVDDEVLYPILEDILEHCPDLTFFETATVAALVVFGSLKVEVSVLEVGLGGRLDATNVLDAPRACAITRIALDHEDRLGSDLASIAREKAGIIKPGVPLVVGPLDPVSLCEIEDQARAAGARLIRADTSDLRSFVAAHPPALDGAHQLDNAQVAVALAREAGLSDEAIVVGLRSVRWDGRLELLHTPSGQVLLDAAHNPDGAAALAAALRTRGRPKEEVALVFGAMADKDYRSMLRVLSPSAAHRVYLAPEGRRPVAPALLAEALAGAEASHVQEALELARKAVGPSGLVVVAGSIFLVGAVRAALLGIERDPAIAL